MTIGQRIAERRKMLGISQENLGEQMGVSRQAISKWEADGAIPEIDKLIALSKLFGVSVGWLLGTENDEDKEAAAPTREDGLNEEQLKMVEQIVRRYQQAQPEPKRNPLPMLLCLGCAVVALILSVVGLSRTSRQFPNYDYQLNDLNNGYSAIRSQLYELVGQLDEMAEGEKLLSEFDASFTALPDWEKARMVFKAIPKTYQEGDRAYLSLRQGNSIQYAVECNWDGVAFYGSEDIAYGEYDSYFVLCRPDASQTQQNVTEAFYGLPYSLEPTCEADVFELGWDLKNKTVSLDAFVMWVEPPWIMTQEEGLEWTKLDLVVKHNGKEVQRLDLQKVCEDAYGPNSETGGFFESAQSVPVSPEYEAENVKDISMLLERFQPLEFELSELREGDRIEFAVEGVLSNGYSFTKEIKSYMIG